jgi:hypothetical protein
MAALLAPGTKIQLIPHIEMTKPMRILVTLEERLSQTRLMGFLGREVSPFMTNIIFERFQGHGDITVGDWPPLAQYTERIKRTMGAPRNAPNIRTGQMLNHLMHDHDVEPTADGALLRIPGSSTPEMQKKIRTAQEGDDGSNNPFGSSTPPRPVLSWGAMEEAGINALFDRYLWAGLH